MTDFYNRRYVNGDDDNNNDGVGIGMGIRVDKRNKRV